MGADVAEAARVAEALVVGAVEVDGSGTVRGPGVGPVVAWTSRRRRRWKHIAPVMGEPHQLLASSPA